MLRIDWGEVKPTEKERRYVEAKIATWRHLDGPTIQIGRRTPDSFEARMSVRPKKHATEVRLQGDDVCGLVDCLLGLLAIASGEAAWAEGEGTARRAKPQ